MRPEVVDARHETRLLNEHEVVLAQVRIEYVLQKDRSFGMPVAVRVPAHERGPRRASPAAGAPHCYFTLPVFSHVAVELHPVDIAVLVHVGVVEPHGAPAMLLPFRRRSRLLTGLRGRGLVHR